MSFWIDGLVGYCRTRPAPTKIRRAATARACRRPRFAGLRSPAAEAKQPAAAPSAGGAIYRRFAGSAFRKGSEGIVGRVTIPKRRYPAAEAPDWPARRDPGRAAQPLAAVTAEVADTARRYLGTYRPQPNLARGPQPGNISLPLTETRADQPRPRRRRARRPAQSAKAAAGVAQW